MTVGQEYGAADAREHTWRRWWLLQTSGCDDRDLSDYWEGRAKGARRLKREEREEKCPEDVSQ